MGQNIVNCVTVGWQAVCYFNCCHFISFLFFSFAIFVISCFSHLLSYLLSVLLAHPLNLPLAPFHGFLLPLLTTSASLLWFILSILIFPHPFFFNYYFFPHLSSLHFMSCPVVIIRDRQDMS